MKLTQHVPGFVSGLPPKVVERDTAAEMLRVPWVRQYAAGVESARFCKSRGHADRWLLMVDGYRDKEPYWWVIGYLTDGDVDSFDLPVWEYPGK